MNEITYATIDDITEIMSVMEIGHSTTKSSDWYVTDDRAFVERHIQEEGYTLKYVRENKIAGFLIVRHPMLAEDNLGRYLEEYSENILLKVAHMESAAVLPDFRGWKIQRKLLARAEEIERERGTQYLMATVHPDNVYSVRNLEQAGFECILETEKYSGLRRKVMSKKIKG